MDFNPGKLTCETWESPFWKGKSSEPNVLSWGSSCQFARVYDTLLKQNRFFPWRRQSLGELLVVMNHLRFVCRSRTRNLAWPFLCWCNILHFNRGWYDMLFEVQISGVTYIITLQKLEVWQITIYDEWIHSLPLWKAFRRYFLVNPMSSNVKCNTLRDHFRCHIGVS